MNEDNYSNFFESLFGASQSQNNVELKKATDALYDLFQALMSSGFTPSEAISLIGTTIGAITANRKDID